jgi:uncharacterized repeat protein (TIGR01451 family)
MRRTVSCLVPAVLLVLVAGAPAAGVDAPAGWTAKVDPWVLGTARAGQTEFLVFMAEQADVFAAAALATRDEKAAFVSRRLREVAARTQGGVLADLARLGVEHRPYWVANMVWVRGGMDVVMAMAARADVARVAANPSVPLDLVPPDPSAYEPAAPDGIEWGVSKIGAPSVWGLGFAGQGVVVGGQDTGYDWDHPALINAYRGWSGSSANHNYNWHDAIHSGGGSCGPDSPEPCDDQSHGTHTMGTMVGDDGGTNQIGVAPGARWIGCRNMNQGNGTPATYSECFQWFIAPTDLAGQNPDPSKAPHVINNSWGCPVSEGCTDVNVLKTVVENTRAAGIVVVVSAGNAGSGCSSVNDPPAIYQASFSIGATDSSDTIAGFSSRGPVTVDGSGRMKPDVSAPGVSIRSSVPGGGYGSMSGTSMAGPHAAGAVALLLSAAPSWKGQVTLVEDRFKASALPRTTTQECGGVPGTQVPNNTYGYGRIDAHAAVSVADLQVAMTDAPDPVPLDGLITYSIQVTNNGPIGAAGVSLVDTIPANATYVESTAWCTLAGSSLTCSIGAVPTGAVRALTITLRADTTDPVVNTVSVSGSQPDPNAANNQATTTTTVTLGADVALGGVLAPQPIMRGSQATYSLTVTNAGPATATAVTLTDVLPAGVSFVSATAPCGHVSGTVTCALGDMASGASAPLQIVVAAVTEGSYTNTPAVAAMTADPSATNNVASIPTTVVTAQAAGLAADTLAATGTASNLNGVLEPGEAVSIAPAWLNPSGAAAALAGAGGPFSGPAGAAYTLIDGSSAYGTVAAGAIADCLATGDCFVAHVSDPASRPALHWDATLVEDLGQAGAKGWTLHIGESFSDVPPTGFGYRDIETVLHNGITAGCSASEFCPTQPVSRWQMAVFIAKAMNDGAVPTSGTVPGKGDYDCVGGGTSVFDDVAPEDPGCAHVHYIAAEGITAGCDADSFCPASVVDRWQMAVFLAKAMTGGTVPTSGTVPGKGNYDCVPGGLSVFDDVPPEDGGCPHVHHIAAEAVTAGCSPTSYCPADAVTREQMAVFITKGFDLTLYGP